MSQLYKVVVSEDGQSLCYIENIPSVSLSLVGTNAKHPDIISCDSRIAIQRVSFQVLKVFPKAFHEWIEQSGKVKKL